MRKEQQDVTETTKKRRAYFRKYNKVRMNRYHTDSDYRQKILDRERANYQKKAKPVNRGYGKNHGKAKEFSTTLRVQTEDGGTLMMGVLTLPKMAEFMGVVYMTLRNWIANDLFPAPNKMSQCGKVFYTREEANALAKVVYKTVDGASLRTTNKEAIEALQQAFDDLQ